MYLPLMVLLMLAFAVAVVYFAKAAVLQFEQQTDGDVFRVKEVYLKIIHQKDALAAERIRLQDAAERIFNLYDLMRALTQSVDVPEALGVFKEHLNRQITLEDCQLVEHCPKDLADFPSFKGYSFFPLKAKKKVLGELAYKGLRPEDEEAFFILAQQFALALRRIRLCLELEDMSITDSLTGAHTRRYFSGRFEDEFGRAKLKGLALSLLMIDVDYFKKVNDQHGHLVGDQVLREVSRLIVQHTREIDITGRYGGEEFCVILPDTDKTGALVAAERIRAAVQGGRIKAYDAELSVTVSIGVATFAQDAGQTDELMDKADWALYRAKKMGRNRVVGFSVYLST
ncbi:MAG: GGDEF domain-containing protein [Candidatus Omnitrophica bacterium]|nr:GGDEF domain-containing protein [Candidatus Omnitrophota bacterium]